MASYVGNKPLFGNFDKLDDISSSFNGSANTFAMTSNSRGVTAGDETQVVISLNGVIQEPVTDYFLATTGQIQFTTAPASGTAFFGYVTGNIGGTASTITDGIVTTAKLANTAGTGSAVQLAANTTALTVAANGNIGIGTTSPTSFANYTTVAINGTTGSIIDLEHGGTINSRVVGESPGLLLDGVGARYIKFHTNSLERMRITSAGNVGIGTVPTALFGSGTTVEIKGTSGAALRLARPSYATADLYADENGLTVRTQNNFAMIFATNSTEHMRINTAGNVGIGTSSPQAKLQVLDQLKVSSSDQSSGSLVLGDGSSTNFNVGIARWNGATNSAGAGGVGYFSQGSVNAGGHFFYTGDASAGSTTERMRIDSSGNLLVGMTAVSGTTDGLHFRAGIASGINVTNDHTIALNRKSSDGEILRFLKDGSAVGSIGSSSGRLYIGSPEGSDSFIRFNSNEVVPSTSAGGARDNAINLGASAARFKDLYLSGGVYLGGTGSANYLEDYEYGTWTPTMGGASTGQSTITSSQTITCRYIRVGRLVHLNVGLNAFDFADNTTFSGALQIAGLPFTVVSGTYESRAGDVYFYPINQWRSTTTNFVGITARINGGSDVIGFGLSILGADRQESLTHTNTNFGTGQNKYLRFTITYETDA